MVASELALVDWVMVVVVDGAFVAGRVGVLDGIDATTLHEVRKGNVDN